MVKHARRYVGDFLRLGTLDGREVVAYRVYDSEAEGKAMFSGVAFRDEAMPLIRAQVELLGTVVSGSPASTIDLNERKRGQS